MTRRRPKRRPAQVDSFRWASLSSSTPPAPTESHWYNEVMTRGLLVSLITDAIGHEEGFYVTLEQARSRGIAFPTLAQRNCNPGNIIQWKNKGAPYPKADGKVDFRAWAKGNVGAGLVEGWRVLAVLVGKYIDGHYHQSRSPNLAEMFERYAPAADANDPRRYAINVAGRTGIPLDTPLRDLIARSSVWQSATKPKQNFSVCDDNTGWRVK